MRLINTTTLHLEEFPGLVPKYAILSHTWGSQEVSLQDWRQAHSVGYIVDVYSSLSRTNSNVPASGGSGTNPTTPRIVPITNASTWPVTGRTATSQAHTATLLGFFKILKACLRARCDGLDYLWVDTNCIDKTSSAELSEAINSMYAWYRNSTVCYAYLSDVPRVETAQPCSAKDSPFRNSRWFKRGWTLQELLAPREMTFFSADWTEIGSTETMSELISDITGIDARYLLQDRHITSASIAHRMSWVSDRTTTRPEDIAYCLLGIFDVNMPLIYGEGSKAFVRLQEEIIRVSEDHSIFAWTWIQELSGPLMRGNRRNTETASKMREVVKAEPRKANFPSYRLGGLMENTLWQCPSRSTLLAPDPICFFDSGQFRYLLTPSPNVRPFAMTNAGLTIELPLIRHIEGGLVFAVLHEQVDGRNGSSELICVPLVRHHEHQHRYTRTWFPAGPVRIVRERRMALEPAVLSVCRDVQHVRFYYPGFGGTGHNWGFWLMVPGRERADAWTLAGGYTATNGVYNTHGLFFDVPEGDQSRAGGGLLVFDGPERKPFVVIVFLAVTLVPGKMIEGKRHLGTRYHCDVIVQERTARKDILEPAALASLYRTLSNKHYGSASTRTAHAGMALASECRLWIRNEWPISHTDDTKAIMTEIMFGTDR